MPPGKPPGNGDIQGRCHICREERTIHYCVFCAHWTCEECNKKHFRRGLAAAKELLGWRTPGCCGPVTASFN